MKLKKRNTLPKQVHHWAQKAGLEFYVSNSLFQPLRSWIAMYALKTKDQRCVITLSRRGGFLFEWSSISPRGFNGRVASYATLSKFTLRCTSLPKTYPEFLTAILSAYLKVAEQVNHGNTSPGRVLPYISGYKKFLKKKLDYGHHSPAFEKISFTWEVL